MSKERSKEVLTVAMNAWANRSKIIDTQTLAMGVLGLKDTEGKPFMSEEELKHPFEFLVLNQLVVPLINEMIPEGAYDKMSTSMSAKAAKRKAGRDEEMEDLKARFNGLESKLNELLKKKK